MSQPPTNAGSLGLMPWILIQCSLPHGRQVGPDGVEKTRYTRRNGSAELVVVAGPTGGLPYGKVPRLLLAWTVREYRRRIASLPSEEARQIDLGRSYSEFLRTLGMQNSGGEKGDRTRLGNQAVRLFTATVHHLDQRAADSSTRWKTQQVSEEGRVWWDPRAPEVDSLFPSYVKLTPGFALACDGAVPVDMDTMKRLRSPFQIDLYTWLSYRAGGLYEAGGKSVAIGWHHLGQQFGHSYSSEKAFRANFRKNLRKVLDHYPVRVETNARGIVVFAKPAHVARRRAQ